MSFFSKLFKSSDNIDISPNPVYESIKLYCKKAKFYKNALIFQQSQQRTVNDLMIHPQAGIIIFNYFNYHAHDLDGVTASLAKGKKTKADVSSRDDKNYIEQRLDEVFHTQIAPVRSILICSNLNEEEFDALDESFHELLPKDCLIFKDTPEEAYKDIFHILPENNYDTSKIQQGLFSQYLVPELNILMSEEQEDAINTEIDGFLNIQGLPGSGKTSVLIARAIYEKMLFPEKNLIIFTKLPCLVHKLQALIFSFVEHSHWGINPADINVSSFDSIQKRAHDKEKYDFIVCDDINEDDVKIFKGLLKKGADLLSSSSNTLEDVKTVSLVNNYRLFPPVCAACEGLIVDNLSQYLELKSGNTFMNTLLILKTLLQDNSADKISIVHHNKEDLLHLQTEIDNFFQPITQLYDSPGAKEGILLYPLSQLACIDNDHLIIIIDKNIQIPVTELISRARQKSFILSETPEVEQLINHIQGEKNETD